MSSMKVFKNSARFDKTWSYFLIYIIDDVRDKIRAKPPPVFSVSNEIDHLKKGR